MTPKSSNCLPGISPAIRRVVPAAPADEVMIEQLEFLLEHAQGGDCGCSQCERYRYVRAILLDAFSEPAKCAAAAPAMKEEDDTVPF